MKLKNIYFLLSAVFILFFSSFAFAEEIHFQWTASSDDVNGYRIYYGATSGDYPFKVDAGNVTDYFFAADLVEDVPYYFVVRAYNDSGESVNSNEVMHTVSSADPDSIPPRDVTSVRKESLFGSLLKLAWKNPYGLDGSGQAIPENQDFAGVMIRYNTEGSYPADHTEGTLFGDKPGSLDQDDNFTGTIDPVNDCKFSFFTYDADGNFSSTVHLTVDTTLPDQVGSFTAVPGDGEVELGWTNPSENFSGVMIRCSTGSAPADYTEGSLVYQGSGGSFTHTQGVANDSTYYYSAFSYNAAGNYNTAVTTGATPTAASNTAPSASTTGSQESGAANEAVNFVGSGTDIDGNIVSYLWAFGDGATSVARNPVHTFDTPDTYPVTLTVTDNEGASGSDSVDVVIGADLTPPSIVSAVEVK